MLNTGYHCLVGTLLPSHTADLVSASEGEREQPTQTPRNARQERQSHTNRQAGREPYRPTCTQTDWHITKQTYRQAGRQTAGQADRQPHTQTNRQTDEQTDRQAGGQ